MGCHFLFQGIFPTQRLSPVPPALAGGFFTLKLPRKPNYCITNFLVQKKKHNTGEGGPLGVWRQHMLLLEMEGREGLSEARADKCPVAGPVSNTGIPATWTIRSNRPNGVRGISGKKRCYVECVESPRKRVPWIKAMQLASRWIICLLKKQLQLWYWALKETECLTMWDQVTMSPGLFILSWILLYPRSPKAKKWKWSRSVMSDSLRPHGL